MAEKLAPTPERHHKAPETTAEHAVERRPANTESRALEEAQKEVESLAAIQQSLEQKVNNEAVSGKEVTVGEKEEQAPQFYLTRELKQTALGRSLKRIQTHLNTPEKTFSKIIHQPTIQKLSDLGARSISRPSGILAGGSLAFIGSVITLYMAKHYGFRYNFSVFIVLFVTGFISGLGIELFIKLARRNRT